MGTEVNYCNEQKKTDFLSFWQDYERTDSNTHGPFGLKPRSGKLPWWNRFSFPRQEQKRRTPDACIGMNAKGGHSTSFHSVYLPQARFWKRRGLPKQLSNNWKFPELHSHFNFTDLFFACLVMVKEQGNSVQLFVRHDEATASREVVFCNLSRERMHGAELCQELHVLVPYCALTLPKLCPQLHQTRLSKGFQFSEIQSFRISTNTLLLQYYFFFLRSMRIFYVNSIRHNLAKPVCSLISS